MTRPREHQPAQLLGSSIHPMTYSERLKEGGGYSAVELVKKSKRWQEQPNNWGSQTVNRNQRVTSKQYIWPNFSSLGASVNEVSRIWSVQ